MLRPSTLRAASFLAVFAVSALVACSKKEEPAPAAAAAPAPAPAAAAPAAAKPEIAHAFKIGELSAVALSDGFLEFPNDLKIFGLGHTVEDVNALLTPAGLPTDPLHLDLHPLLVKTSDKVLLFDTGAAALFGPNTGHIQDALAAAGVDPQSVTDIFISHSHGDHVGGLVTAEGKLAFPNATIHLSNPEWKFMSGQSQLAPIVAAIKPKVDAFAPGAELIPGVVKAVEIKGHTPGHSGYKITSGSESLLYVGDAVHHYIISVQRPDWPMSFDSDQAVGAKSRAALLADSAASGQRIYAVHFPFPGIGHFEKQGDGFVWVAE